MKLTCTLEKFKKAILNAERVIGKQITLPILENVLLETENRMLKISATNLEIGVSLKIGAKIEKEGKITVPAKLLSSFISNLPPENQLILEVIDQNLKIYNGKYLANIKGLIANEFPIIPEINGEYLFSISAQEIKNIIPKILSCVSFDTTRPELTGINLIFNSDSINLASTDSFQLIEIKIIPKKSLNYEIFIKKTNSIIIPANTLMELARIIDLENKEIEVAIEESQIFFQIGTTKIVSRLINGKYPEYKQIIPEKFETSVFLNTEEFSRAIKIASLFTNTKTGEIFLKINPHKKEIIVSANSEEKGENHSKLEGEIKGKEIDVIFNPRHFLNGVNNISTPIIALLLNTEESPVAFCNVLINNNQKEILKNFIYIVKPIRNEKT